MKVLLALLTLFAASPSTAQSQYEQFLLPVVLFDPFHGAYNSVWTTELVLRNTSPDPVAFRPHSCGQLSVVCNPSGQLRPHETLETPPIWYSAYGSWAPHGLFLYLERPASRVTVSLHLRELARSAGWGTRLPVVRADETFTAPVDILNVPTDSRYRHTLRVYSLDNDTPAPFRILLYDRDASSDAAPLKEIVVNTTTVINHHEDDYPLLPGYAQVDLNVEATPAVAAAQRLRVTVEPLVAGRFWTYLSVTDNATQQLTLFTREH